MCGGAGQHIQLLAYARKRDNAEPLRSWRESLTFEVFLVCVGHSERTHGVPLHTSSFRKGPWHRIPGCVRGVVVPFAEMAAGGCIALVGCGRVTATVPSGSVQE